MILLADRPLDHEFAIDATLAYALDMFSTRTTLKRLGQYVMDQVYPSRSYDYPGSSLRRPGSSPTWHCPLCRPTIYE